MKKIGVQSPKSQNKSKNILIGLASIVVIALIAVAFSKNIFGFDTLKGEWEVVEDSTQEDKMKIQINKDEFIVSYNIPEFEIEQKMYYTLDQPEDSTQPYSTTGLKRYEFIIPNESISSEEFKVEPYLDLGFELEEGEETSILSTENITKVEKELKIPTQEFHIFAVEDTLELVYADDYNTGFLFARPTNTNTQHEEYVGGFSAVVDGLLYPNNGGLKKAHKQLTEIEKTQPSSKLVSIYKKMIELAEEYEIAVENADESSMTDTINKLSDVPLSSVFGIAESFKALHETNLSYISQVKELDQTIEDSKTALSEEEFEKALDIIQIDSSLMSYIESYHTEKYDMILALHEEINTAIQTTISLDDFKGYWATYDEVSYSDIGTHIFYLSDEYEANAIASSEFAMSHVENYSLNGDTLSLELQRMHGQSNDEYIQYSYDLVLEKGPEGKTLTFDGDSDIVFYPVPEEEYFSQERVDFEEKGNEIYETYKERVNQLAIIEADPFSYLLDKIFISETVDSRLTYSFREKDLSSEEAGIGEVWYHRESNGEAGVQARAMQFLIHDVTFEDYVFKISVSEGFAKTEPEFDMEYVYIDESSIYSYDSDTGEYNGIYTIVQ